MWMWLWLGPAFPGKAEAYTRYFSVSRSKRELKWLQCLRLSLSERKVEKWRKTKWKTCQVRLFSRYFMVSWMLWVWVVVSLLLLECLSFASLFHSAHTETQQQNNFLLLPFSRREYKRVRGERAIWRRRCDVRCDHKSISSPTNCKLHISKLVLKIVVHVVSRVLDRFTNASCLQKSLEIDRLGENMKERGGKFSGHEFFTV